MFELFMTGGPFWMSILTLELVALLLAAWKAPGWVKEIGLIALVTAVLNAVTGFSHAAKVVMEAGDISPYLVWGGIRSVCIPVGYGLVVYAVSLVIRVVQKPRML